MAWGFRKRKKLIPGLTLSLGKRGFGIRVGPRGAGVTISPSGKRVSASLPGTGLFVSTKLGSGQKAPESKPPQAPSSGRTVAALILIAIVAIAVIVAFNQ